MRLLVALLSLHLVICLGFVGVTAAFLALVRGERLRVHRAALGWFFREWLGTALVMAIHPLGWWMRPPRAARGMAREPDVLPPGAALAPPVILVPGYAMNRTCFVFLAAWLRQRGWRWVWPVNNTPVSSPIPVYAASLARRVEALCQASGAEQVDIVAHSMGGLVAAWYLQQLGGKRRVRRLVTLGAPWQGSMIAVFGQRREALDLRPGSDVVRAIGPPLVPTTCIWSREDTIVLPPEHARREGTDEQQLAWHGHVMLLLSPRAWRLVGVALAGLEAHSDEMISAANPRSQSPGQPPGAQDDRDALPQPASAT